MTNTLMYLVKNPRTLEKLVQELDEATVSNPPGAIPTYDQVRNLPYLTACINESMRLRPVAATGTVSYRFDGEWVFARLNMNKYRSSSRGHRGHHDGWTQDPEGDQYVKLPTFLDQYLCGAKDKEKRKKPLLAILTSD